MTRDEAKKILFILNDNYPSTYKNMTNDEKRRQIDNYVDFFGEYPIEIMVPALKNYIRSNKFPPTVAGLQEQISLMMPNGSDAELWSLVEKASSNGTYGSEVEYKKLPEECQRWLGSPSALKDLALVAPEIIATVVRGEFFKTIKDVKRRVKVQRMLPPETRQAIVTAKERLLLIEESEGG